MTVTGVWVNHPSYGPQITCEQVERRMPREEDEMVSYLASGIIKGVGQTTAQRLVETFGADTLRVIEEEPERMSRIKGVTAKKAMEISRAFREVSSFLTCCTVGFFRDVIRSSVTASAPFPGRCYRPALPWYPPGRSHSPLQGKHWSCRRFPPR